MLPEFFYCQNETELPGAGMVFCTRPPYMLFKALKFTQQDEELFLKAPGQPFAKVPAYRVYLQYYGQLELNQYRSIAPPTVQQVLSKAVQFYTTEKITPNAYQFKRYKTE